MATTSLDKLSLRQRTYKPELLTLVTPTTQIGANSTTPVTAVAIGFSFELDGTAYTDLSEISPFGIAAFVGTAIPDSAANLFANSSTRRFIAPFYGPFKTAITTGYVKTELQGQAPFRRFVIEWKCYPSNAHTATDNDTLTFQVVLYETRNQFELRYGARVRTGTPGTLGIIACGFRSNTMSVATNYRDLAVQNLALGGSKTTTTQDLDMADYDALVGTRWVIQPNWPMSGRAFMLGPDELGGVDPYEMVFWKIANFVNWLWCHHCPALVNFSPFQQTGYASVDYVIPMVASDEGLDYQVYAQVYTSNNTTCTISVDVDDAADPQWDEPTDWDNLDSSAQSVTASAWNELTAFDVTIPADGTHIRITASVSAGTVIVGSVLIVPKAMSEIDPSFVSLTGFFAMGIHHLYQDGAAVHGEWLNRAWRNIAHILRDRRQCVWSSVWPEISKAALEQTTERPERTIGVAKAFLPVAGAAAKLRTYTHDLNGAGELRVAEEGHALLAQHAVDDAGGEYRTNLIDVFLLSAEPLITASCQPDVGMVSALSPMTVVIDWAPTLSTSNLYTGVTPSPKLAGLFAIAFRMDLALRCYAYTGIATMLARGKTTSNRWRVQWPIGPAVKALRAKIARDNDDHNAASADSVIVAASSGSGGSDEILVPSPHPHGRDDYPPEGVIAIASTAEHFDDSPGSSVSRYLESPTETSMEGAVRERVEVVRGVGITLVPVYANALEL